LKQQTKIYYLTEWSFI